MSLATQIFVIPSSCAPSGVGLALIRTTRAATSSQSYVDPCRVVGKMHSTVWRLTVMGQPRTLQVASSRAPTQTSLREKGIHWRLGWGGHRTSHRKRGGVWTNFSQVPRGRGPLLTSLLPILCHKVVFAGLRVLNRACMANPPTLPRPLAGSWGRAGSGGEPGAWCQENPPPLCLTTTLCAGSGVGEAAVKISRSFQPERRGQSRRGWQVWCVGSVSPALPLACGSL